jgi:hypothetical protein
MRKITTVPQIRGVVAIVIVENDIGIACNCCLCARPEKTGIKDDDGFAEGQRFGPPPSDLAPSNRG